jgi:hypothetical protein
MTDERFLLLLWKESVPTKLLIDKLISLFNSEQKNKSNNYLSFDPSVSVIAYKERGKQCVATFLAILENTPKGSYDQHA